tara:strand:- start:357 stop:494 length:138 start_codon:yes stop_codon:yes gene_type:complete
MQNSESLSNEYTYFEIEMTPNLITKNKKEQIAFLENLLIQKLILN